MIISPFDSNSSKLEKMASVCTKVALETSLSVNGIESYENAPLIAYSVLFQPDVLLDETRTSRLSSKTITAILRRVLNSAPLNDELVLN